MLTKHTASALALAAAAALMLAACGGGDDDPAPRPNPGPNPAPTAILPEVIDFDAREELLRPGATVRLKVELETLRDRDVPAAGAANVEVSLISDTTGGAQLSGKQFSTNQMGEARFNITLGPNAGTVILKASTDRADNNVANGITDELSLLLGMLVTQAGNGLNWELPPVVEARSGGSIRLEDADDGARGRRTYSVSGAGGFTLAECGDDVCLTTPAATGAGSYDLDFTVTDAAGSTLTMPVTVEVR